MTKENPSLLNKNKSTSQFTIGFNAPSFNLPNVKEKFDDDNKATKIIINFMPSNLTNKVDFEEKLINECELNAKMKSEVNSKNTNLNLIKSNSKESEIEVNHFKIAFYIKFLDCLQILKFSI